MLSYHQQCILGGCHDIVEGSACTLYSWVEQSQRHDMTKLHHRVIPAVIGMVATV